LSELTELLACPRCDTALNAFCCPSCQLQFPIYDDVPWLVPDPDTTRFEWRNRWQMAQQQLELRQRSAREAIATASLPATRDRLANLAVGYAAQHRALKSLLKSLGLARPADLTTYLALKTRLPSHVGLTSYDANVFRDWCWGDSENESSAEAVRSVLANQAVGSLLILGAGAGRLAYDLHRSPGRGEGLTVALDINPYLTTILKKLVSGESLQQVEFPLAPKTGDRSAIERNLRAPEPLEDSFEVILGDALHPPFLAESFDTVLTPWLIDVLDSPPESLLHQVNRLLKPGGRWVLHGSLAFNRADVCDDINLEELKMLAQGCGFGVLECVETRGPYLDCPDSRHGRLEEVLTMSADKLTCSASPERHQNLPDWIVEGHEPVPLLPAFKAQAMATRVHAFIMSMIDGKRTVRDMAVLMEQQQLMEKADAEPAIRGFLVKMFDEASSSGGL